jgi:prephenate dehydratase
MPLRVTYLGPAGTFTEDALRAAAGDAPIDAVASPTVYDAIVAVDEGDSERALVPFENSIEGSVRATLDTLAFDAGSVTIVGEHDHPISHSLIARSELPLEEIEVVLSHPQANAQCAHFIRRELSRAEVRAVASTAEAVRAVSESESPWAALGATSAARIYACVVLREGVEDSPDNVTRFVWLAPAGTELAGDGRWRTTLVFSELGEDHPGALVDALTEFSRREVNLTRIESRPLRRGLGRYMFFVDLEGPESEPIVAEAIDGLRAKAETVRILGSYPVETGGIPGYSGVAG